jgi:formate dehydrogenase subunit gamma
LFAWLTGFAKNLHNFVAPLFIVTLPIFILIYVKDNLPEKGDVKWMLNAWKLFLGRHMPSGKYNAGEKAWFWGGVVFLSLTLCISGAVLLFPNFEQLRSTMQQAHVVHVVAAVLVIAAALGHIYLGTIGMDGAYRNMRDGVTDETWAKEHHENWYNDVKSGKAPGDAPAKPTGAPQTQH